MKILLAILLSACVYISANKPASGPPRWDEVTVTMRALTKIPRTQAEAEEQGWSLLQSDCPPATCVKSEGGTANGACCQFPFVYNKKTYSACTSTNHNQPWCSTTSNYDGNWGNCPPTTDIEKSPFVGERFVGKNGDQTVILIYGANGHLAGIQFSYVRDKETADAPDGEARILYKGRTYATAYFTDTSKVCNADAPTEAGIIAEKLIFLAGKGKEREIPRQQSSITSESGWKEGKCMPGMGNHYWYKHNKDSLCEEMDPFMLMFDKRGNLNAFGFLYFHAIKSSWAEKPFGNIMPYLMKLIPDCIKKSTHQMASMHVFLSSDKSRRECDYSRL